MANRDKTVDHYDACFKHAVIFSNPLLREVKSLCEKGGYSPVDINMRRVFSDGDCQWMFLSEYSHRDASVKSEKESRKWFLSTDNNALEFAPVSLKEFSGDYIRQSFGFLGSFISVIKLAFSKLKE